MTLKKSLKSASYYQFCLDLQVMHAYKFGLNPFISSGNMQPFIPSRSSRDPGNSAKVNKYKYT